MSIGDNIKKLREMHDLTQEQLAEKLGVTRESVVKWESGKINVRDRHISKLVELFGIEPDDIRSENYGLAAKGHGRVGTPTIKPTYSYHVVPMLGNVAAGEWREVYEQRDETVHIPDVFADPHPRAFGVKPAGNSMDLIFGDKEIAICDPDLEVRDKDIAVVGVNGDEATIKRVFFAGNMIVLHAESSDEDSYPDIAIDLKDPASPPVHMIGRVFWKTLPAKEMSC